MRPAPTIALALGDPNGIGPEIAVKAAAQLALDKPINVHNVERRNFLGFRRRSPVS